MPADEHMENEQCRSSGPRCPDLPKSTGVMPYTHAHKHTDTQAHARTRTTLQIEEGWRTTDLAPSIELFERGFLAGCQRASRAQLGMLSREAASHALNSGVAF